MKRALFVAGIVVPLAVLATIQGGHSSMDRNSQDMQILVRIEQQLAEATMRRAAAVYEHLMADDFIGIDHLGQELTKPQILARLDVTDYELASLTHENIRVRVFSDCAVATARTVMRGRFKGQDVSGEFPYLRVWIKRKGRWQAVATQSTMVPVRQSNRPSAAKNE